MGRITYVIEYPDGEEPAIHAGMEIAGGELVAVQFNDALEELDAMFEQIGDLLMYGD